MTSALPTSAGSTIASAALAVSTEPVKSLNYRCPLCGRMVDATNANEILLHHEHVTHPRDFLEIAAAIPA